MRFGGLGRSGVGREGGTEGLAEYARAARDLRGAVTVPRALPTRLSHAALH
jgi:acyl-CoA reductase-like NAD-dependent aldehyde dehydrogenase